MKPEFQVLTLLDELDGVAHEFDPMHFEVHPDRWFRVSFALRAAIAWLQADDHYDPFSPSGVSTTDKREAFRKSLR